MLYVPQDFGKIEVRRLMSTGDGTPDGLYFPYLLAGKYVKADIVPSFESIEHSRDIDVDSAVSAGSCSADTQVADFFDMSKNKLKYPFVVEPGASVIGRTYLMLTCGSAPFTACVETRSRYARRGLVCEGFYIDDQKRSVVSRNIEELDFVFQNYSQNSIRVTQPFSPVQVTKTIGLEHPGLSRIRIKCDGKDVTEDRRLGNLLIPAYYTTLGPELLYFRRTGKALDIEDKDGFEALAVRTSVDELPDGVDFCLTLTKEEIDTNGSPVYMLPAHYLDLMSNSYLFYDKPELAAFFETRLLPGTDCMPVTGNAGLINPGSCTRTVCENIVAGRDRLKYFKVGEPFAIVAPIPLIDGESSHEYKGYGATQARIEV